MGSYSCSLPGANSHTRSLNFRTPDLTCCLTLGSAASSAARQGLVSNSLALEILSSCGAGVNPVQHHYHYNNEKYPKLLYCRLDESDCNIRNQALTKKLFGISQAVTVQGPPLSASQPGLLASFSHELLWDFPSHRLHPLLNLFTVEAMT